MFAWKDPEEWCAAWVWQLSRYISLLMQALITGRLDRFDRRQLTLWDSCSNIQDTGLESETWMINIQLCPEPLSILVFVWSKHHTHRQQISVQRIFLSFSVFYNWINVCSSWPLLPCPDLEIIGIASFKDSYNGNEHVSGLVSGFADLISACNKEQLPLKY